MRKVILLLFVFIQFSVFAQHDIYLGGQVDMGLVGATMFENNTLSKKFFSPHFGASAFVNFRLFDIVSFEVGAGQHWNNSRFRDPSFERENEGFSVEMSNKNYYWNYYAAATGLYRIGRTETYLYGKLAYSINEYGEETATNTKSFIITRLNTDQTLVTTSSYKSTGQSLIPEIGIQQMLVNRHLISFGLRMNIGSEDILNGVYTVRNNLTEEVESDIFSSPGDFIALSFRYSMSLHHIPKKEKVRRIPGEQEKKLDGITQAPDTNRSTEIANRKLIVTQKVKVHTPKVTIMIWDHQTVDGDRVSLNFNGEWVLKNYELEKKKYSFELELKEGVNTFVLHALNLGKYEPNTAALIVKEGIKSHQIILESDLNESGTLEILYKKKKE